MWWATTALTTVGYGDIAPITPVGRFLGSVVAFMGVAVFGLPAGIIAAGFQELLANQAQDACPSCGSIRLPDAIFCRKCGLKRDNVCDYCNNIFAYDAVFCRKCGRQVGNQSISKTGNSEVLVSRLEQRLDIIQSDVYRNFEGVQAELSSLRETQQELLDL